jgi:hypothetical protein
VQTPESLDALTRLALDSGCPRTDELDIDDWVAEWLPTVDRDGSAAATDGDSADPTVVAADLVRSICAVLNSTSGWDESAADQRVLPTPPPRFAPDHS